MIQWIKRLLLSKEVKVLETVIQDAITKRDEYISENEKLNKEKQEFNAKKYKWETLQKEEYKTRLEKENLELLQDYKDKLETLIDYRLIPGVRVWVFEPIQGKPEQIEIESVYIKKERISLNNDMYSRYFHSEIDRMQVLSETYKKISS